MYLSVGIAWDYLMEKMNIRDTGIVVKDLFI